MEIKYGIGQKVKWRTLKFEIDEITIRKDRNVKYRCWSVDGKYWTYLSESELDKWN